MTLNKCAQWNVICLSKLSVLDTQFQVRLMLTIWPSQLKQKLHRQLALVEKVTSGELRRFYFAGYADIAEVQA